MVAYQVVGELASFTTSTPAGRMRITINKPGMVPADAPIEEIRHHLSVGLIKPVGVQSVPLSVPLSVPVPASQPDAGGETPPPPPVEPELSEERLAAQAKLPDDGSLPHHNAAKAVWVEAAVKQGYAYEAASSADKADLVKLLKG